MGLGPLYTWQEEPSTPALPSQPVCFQCVRNVFIKEICLLERVSFVLQLVCFMPRGVCLTHEKQWNCVVVIAVLAIIRDPSVYFTCSVSSNAQKSLEISDAIPIL